MSETNQTSDGAQAVETPEEGEGAQVAEVAPHPYRTLRGMPLDIFFAKLVGFTAQILREPAEEGGFGVWKVVPPSGFPWRFPEDRQASLSTREGELWEFAHKQRQIPYPSSSLEQEQMLLHWAKVKWGLIIVLYRDHAPVAVDMMRPPTSTALLDEPFRPYREQGDGDRDSATALVRVVCSALLDKHAHDAQLLQSLREMVPETVEQAA